MTAGLVIDTSIVAAWCLKDEAGAATDEILGRVRNEGALAPLLLAWEVANVLTVAVRRGRMSEADATASLADLALLPMTFDAQGPDRAWRETYILAQSCKLTIYDAAYLELARRNGLDLATKDADLRSAAAALGVKIVP